MTSVISELVEQRRLKRFCGHFCLKYLSPKNQSAGLEIIRLNKKGLKPNSCHIILLTSNYFSILYYNSEVWHLPSFHINLKQYLLAASSAALKLCENNTKIRKSYATLHALNKIATPEKMMIYKMSIQLHKIYNSQNMNEDWIDLHFQQNFNERNDKVQIIDSSRLRIGKNKMVNKLAVLNNKIKYEWLNLSMNAFKLKCKSTFLN